MFRSILVLLSLIGNEWVLKIFTCRNPFEACEGNLPKKTKTGNGTGQNTAKELKVTKAVRRSCNMFKWTFLMRCAFLNNKSTYYEFRSSVLFIYLLIIYLLLYCVFMYHKQYRQRLRDSRETYCIICELCFIV